jgi:hypothetical protein
MSDNATIADLAAHHTVVAPALRPLHSIDFIVVLSFIVGIGFNPSLCCCFVYLAVLYTYSL